MKIISDTLAAVVERWDDPGLYPNSLAQGPLPSYDYVAEVEGEVVVEIEATDFLGETLELDYDLPHGIKVARWQIDKAEQQGRGISANGYLVYVAVLTLTVAEFEAEQVERPEPDYYEED